MQVDDAALLWKACADDLQAQVSDAVWLTCFHSAVPIGIDGDEFVLAVPSTVFKERIETRYQGLVNGALSDAGAPQLNLRVEVRSSESPSLDEAVLVEPPPPAPLGGTPPARRTPSTEERVLINPKYTFDAFVIGTSNRFSHAAALAVAETPARNYNPLFIYGTAGLGKTHLLQAIGNYVIENYPTYTVRYVPTETLLNEFIEAIRRNERTAFKRRYREVDVLLIDDIQFLETQESLQEELFHTFNHLHQANSQIVMSSDRPPNEIATLEERLRSRFKMGLVTEIVPPDIETRLAILRKKAENEHPAPPPDVLDLIATHITSNIRELEGALTRVCAYASLTKEPLSIELAERVLSDVITDSQPRPITPEAILDATCAMFGFPIEEIRGKSRRRPLVIARQISMYVFRELTDLSYPAIAREFGGRDHTTVIHAVEKVTNLMKERRQVYDQVTELIQTIRNGG
jgi:chromosomal replication initiator protein